MHFSAVVVASFACQALATWNDYKSYPNPSNSDNQCSSYQQQGYDWSGLKDGDFSSYGDNYFSGFSCSKSLGKRDEITKRTFQDKCVKADVQKKPSISCQSGKSMSIKHMEVSADRDTKFECHYTMPDKSTCKTTHSCKAGGSVIKNDQCGGATKVTFKPVGGDSKSCNIGVHKVEFNCEHHTTTLKTSTKPATSKTKTKETTTVPKYETTSYKCTTCTEKSTPPVKYSSTTPVESHSSTPVQYSSTPPAYSSTPVQYSSTSLSTSVAIPTSSAPVYYSSGSMPAYKPSSSSAPAVPSSSPVTSETIPVYSSIPAASSYPAPSSYEQPSSAASSYEQPSSYAAPSYASSVAPVYSSTPAPECPEVLPNCLNTWIHTTTCKDNTDFDCLCQQNDFVSKAMECVGAWGSCEERNKAASYFQGLCAKYVKDQPAFITAYPPSVCVAPPSTTSTVYSTATEGTITKTVAVSTTICPVEATEYSTQTVTITSCKDTCPTSTALVTYPVVPDVTYTAPAETWTCPTSLVTYSSVLTVTSDDQTSLTTVATTLTVPQVYATSSSAGESVSVALVAGTPSPAPAVTTGSAPTAATTAGSSPAAGTPAASKPVTYQGAAAQSGISGVLAIVAVLFML